MLQTSPIFIVTISDWDLQARALGGKRLRTHTHPEMKWAHHSTPYHLFIHQNDDFYGCLPSPRSARGQLGFSCFPSFWECWWPHCTLSHPASWKTFPAYSSLSCWFSMPSPHCEGSNPFWGLLCLGLVLVPPITSSHQMCFLPWGHRQHHRVARPARKCQDQVPHDVTERDIHATALSSDVYFLLGIVTLTKPLKFPGTEFPHVGQQ